MECDDCNQCNTCDMKSPDKANLYRASIVEIRSVSSTAETSVGATGTGVMIRLPDPKFCDWPFILTSASVVCQQELKNPRVPTVNCEQSYSFIRPALIFARISNTFRCQGCRASPCSCEIKTPNDYEFKCRLVGVVPQTGLAVIIPDLETDGGRTRSTWNCDLTNPVRGVCSSITLPPCGYCISRDCPLWVLWRECQDVLQQQIHLEQPKSIAYDSPRTTERMLFDTSFIINDNINGAPIIDECGVLMGIVTNVSGDRDRHYYGLPSFFIIDAAQTLICEWFRYGLSNCSCDVCYPYECPTNRVRIVNDDAGRYLIFRTGYLGIYLRCLSFADIIANVPLLKWPNFKKMTGYIVTGVDVTSPAYGIIQPGFFLFTVNNNPLGDGCLHYSLGLQLWNSFPKMSVSLRFINPADITETSIDTCSCLPFEVIEYQNNGEYGNCPVAVTLKTVVTPVVTTTTGVTTLVAPSRVVAPSTSIIVDESQGATIIGELSNPTNSVPE